MLKTLSWQRRLEIERQIVKKELPQFRLFTSNGSARFTGRQKSTDGLSDYELELRISSHYPDERPRLFVTYPKYLSKHMYLGTINELGVSHDFHSLTSNPNDCVEICHFNSESWDASKTVVSILVKGIIWISAYQEHFFTGKTIAKIINEWKARYNRSLINIDFDPIPYEQLFLNYNKPILKYDL